MKITILPMRAGQVASDDVAAKIREARKVRGWKPADLAARCAELGADLTENGIENIESGRRGKDGRRRRHITVDELLVIADALGVPPALLFPELADGPMQLPVSLHGIDDAIAGLQASKTMILARQRRQTAPGQEGDA